MAMQNPFIQRNLPLSELIQRQNRYANTEGSGPSNWYQGAQLRNVNEALDRFRPPPQQMQRPMQPRPMQPRPMQPRPMPRPMPGRPMPQPMVPAPMPAMPAPVPGGISAPPTSGPVGVTYSGGEGMPAMPMDPRMRGFGGFWNSLGLGGGMGGGGQMTGGGMPGGFGYGGYGGGFKGFSAAQPYRGAGGGSFQLDPREMTPGGFR